MKSTRGDLHAEVREIVEVAVLAAIEELPPRALGIRSQALPTETHLSACVEALESVGRVHPCTIVVGASEVMSNAGNVRVLGHHEAAAEATALRNKADRSEGLLLYFGTDSTPGESGLDVLVELSTAEFARLYASRSGLPVLAELAASNARMVRARLDDASIPELAAFTQDARRVSELFALPRLRVLPFGGRRGAGRWLAGATSFDTLRGPKAVNALAAAFKEVEAIEADPARNALAASNLERARSLFLGGEEPIQTLKRLSEWTARYARLGTDEVARLCGLTAEVARALRGGAEGVRALVGPTSTDDPDEPSEADEPILSEDEALEKLGPEELTSGPAEYEVDEGELVTSRNDGSELRLRAGGRPALIRRILDSVGGHLWTEGGAILVAPSVLTGGSPARQADPTVMTTWVEASSECPSALRPLADRFLAARKALLTSVGGIATAAESVLGANPEGTEPEEVTAPAQSPTGNETNVQHAVRLLDAFPLVVALRTPQQCQAYVDAYEALLAAAYPADDREPPQRFGVWLEDLDLAIGVDGRRSEAAWLLPTHPLRVAHALLWARHRVRPPQLPSTLAVHYSQIEPLVPAGPEHTFGVAAAVAPADQGVKLAAAEGLRAAWALLARRGLVSGLVIELVDITAPEVAIEALCSAAQDLLDAHADVPGLHLNVRFAYSDQRRREDVRVALPSDLGDETQARIVAPGAARGEGITVQLAQRPVQAGREPCHLAVQAVETPFVRLSPRPDLAQTLLPEVEIVYSPSPSGAIADVELRGHSTTDRYGLFLDAVRVERRRRGLDPANSPPTVGDAIVRALVARRGWPVRPAEAIGLLSYVAGRDEHVVATLADPRIFAALVSEGLASSSRAASTDPASLESLRRSVASLYDCRDFFLGVLGGKDARHVRGDLGKLRAFEAVRADAASRPALILSIDGPEGRRWARTAATADEGAATRADLVILEGRPTASPTKEIERLRIVELKAGQRAAALASEEALKELARQALVTAGRVRECFAGTPAPREVWEAFRRLYWLGAGHQLAAGRWRDALEWLDSRVRAGSGLEVKAECWIVPEDPWDGPNQMEIEAPSLSSTGTPTGATERVLIRVIPPPPGEEEAAARSVEPPAGPQGHTSPPSGRPRVGAPALRPTASAPVAAPPAATETPRAEPPSSLPAPQRPSPPALNVAAPSSPGQPASTQVRTPGQKTGIRVVLGKQSNGTEALWLPNRTDVVNHFNVGITGTMGTGKTQLTKSLIAQILWNDAANAGGKRPGLLIFDYKGDYVDSAQEPFATAIGATVLRPQGLPLNPLHPSRPTTKQEFMLMAQVFADTLRAIEPQIGRVQRADIIKGVRECYRAAGIDENDPATWTRPFPTLAELAAYLVENDLAEGMPQATIQDLSELEIFAHKDPTDSLDAFFDGVHVINLKPLGGNPTTIRAIICFFVNAFYDRMLQGGDAALEHADGLQFRQIRRLLLVDEADDFLRLNLTSFKNVMQQGRSFGHGAILSTQFLHHFNDSEPPLRPLIGTWVLHQMADVNPSDIKSLFGIASKDEVNRLVSKLVGLPKHTSLCFGLSNEGLRARPTEIRDLPFKDLPRPA